MSETTKAIFKCRITKTTAIENKGGLLKIEMITAINPQLNEFLTKYLGHKGEVSIDYQEAQNELDLMIQEIKSNE